MNGMGLSCNAGCGDEVPVCNAGVAQNKRPRTDVYGRARQQNFSFLEADR